MIPRPAGVSPKLWRKFLAMFTDGTRFWTSIDGDAMDFVIVRRPNALGALRETFPSCDVVLDRATMRETFVDYDWLPREHFDDPYEGAARRGKGWTLTDQPTPFPVLAFDPYAIRAAAAATREDTP